MLNFADVFTCLSLLVLGAVLNALDTICLLKRSQYYLLLQMFNDMPGFSKTHNKYQFNGRSELYPGCSSHPSRHNMGK